MPRYPRKAKATVATEEIKEEPLPKVELHSLKMDHMEEIKVEPLVPLDDPIDQCSDGSRCQFCSKLVSESGGPAVTTRKTITYVLGVRKWAPDSDHPDCCQECKTMFDMFYEFKKSCLAAIARAKVLLSEKNVTSNERDLKIPSEPTVEKVGGSFEPPLQEICDSDMDEKGFQDDDDDTFVEPLPEAAQNNDKSRLDSPKDMVQPETVPKETDSSSSVPPSSSDDLSPTKPKKRRSVKPKAKTPKTPNDELPTANQSATEEEGNPSATPKAESEEIPRKKYQRRKKTTYTCELCSNTFTTEKQWTLHMNRHNGIRTVACRREGCDKKFFDTQHRHAHEIGCGKDVKIMCSVCAAIFRSMSALRTHMAGHGELKFFCKVCGKGFYRKAKLDKHASVHSDARNHECNVCGKRFKSKEANRVHQRVHTEERPYACHICSRAFRYNCGLKAHLERGHDPGELNQPKLKANVNSSDSTIGWF
ncbi:zinc finger protein 449 [Aedes aegypti]|uniref:C2H2-type domain-containing protein n=1 Tax=Aedes aegypti TaxID=7159 RepID=A0A1S4FUP1_AEDAE|nr:zinc finger protein 449 [Aedes aegypti]